MVTELGATSHFRVNFGTERLISKTTFSLKGKSYEQQVQLSHCLLLCSVAKMELRFNDQRIRCLLTVISSQRVHCIMHIKLKTWLIFGTMNTEWIEMIRAKPIVKLRPHLHHKRRRRSMEKGSSRVHSSGIFSSNIMAVDRQRSNSRDN